MTSELPPNSPVTRSFSLSIGQLTFGSFLLVLAVIIITSTASVIAIRHIDSTFAELQRLQSVGDLAEDIDRRMNELRLAARDFVTDPGTQSVQVGDAAASLSDVLKKTRLGLAPEQQDKIDGVTARLATYRSGIERISALINRRAELIVALPPLREAFDKAIAASGDPVIAWDNHGRAFFGAEASDDPAGSLKTFGDVPSPGLLSFPRQGITLTLDFANRGPETLRLLGELEAVVRAASGALSSRR